MNYKKRLVLYFENLEKNNMFRTTETVYVNDGEQYPVLQMFSDTKKAKLIKAYYDFKPLQIPLELKAKKY